LENLKIIWQNKIKIIVTDDHALFRRGVRMALNKWNDMEIVGEAANGQELLNLLDTVMPDIVILNITMPVMDGVETLPRIRKKYPDLKVVVLTMHSDPWMIIKMMSLGANTYLTKNMDASTICEAIRCVHEYGYYYSKAISEVLLEIYTKAESPKQESGYKEMRNLEFLKESKSIKEMSAIRGITERAVAAIKDILEKKNGNLDNNH
jgi:DNA-binding NarL/FixJ family response regulator